MQCQEEAAEVHAEGVLKNQQEQRGIGALPYRIAQNGAGISSVQVFVDLEPYAQGHQRQQGEAQHEDLLLDGQVEEKIPVLRQPDLVGGFESQRRQMTSESPSNTRARR